MYRIIDGQIWLDEKFRKLSANGKLVFIYLFSSHHTNVAGLYFMPVAYVLADVGMPIPQAEHAIQELIDLHMISRHEDWIFVHGMVKHQSKSPKIQKAIQKAFEGCESDELRIIFARHFSGERWSWLPSEQHAARNGTQKGKVDTLSRQEQEQTQRTQQGPAGPACETPASTPSPDSAQTPADDAGPDTGNSILNSVILNPEKNVAEKPDSNKPIIGLPNRKPDQTPEENAGQKKKTTTRRASVPSDQDRALAFFMLEKIKDVAPSATLAKDWTETIRLMRERDGHSHEAIKVMFLWANAHDFWRANILSPKALRRQWVKLEAQRNQPAPIQWPAPDDDRGWSILGHQVGIKPGYTETSMSFQGRVRAAAKANGAQRMHHGQ